MEHLIDLLCLQILRAHTSFPAPSAARPYRGLAQWQVKRVTAYMRDHLAQDIGLQDLADVVRLSRFHFCSAFRMATGHTPQDLMSIQAVATLRARVTEGRPGTGCARRPAASARPRSGPRSQRSDTISGCSGQDGQEMDLRQEKPGEGGWMT